MSHWASDFFHFHGYSSYRFPKSQGREFHNTLGGVKEDGNLTHGLNLKMYCNWAVVAKGLSAVRVFVSSHGFSKKYISKKCSGTSCMWDAVRGHRLRFRQPRDLVLLLALLLSIVLDTLLEFSLANVENSFVRLWSFILSEYESIYHFDHRSWRLWLKKV